MLITGHLGYVGRRLGRERDFVGYDLLEGNDVRDKYKLETVFDSGRFDTVIHLAALTGVRKSTLYPQEYISTNIEGTWNVVKMCEKYQIKKLIFFSSSSVYGLSKPPVKETDEKRPISLYGVTKLTGEEIVNMSTVRTTIIRPFTIYPGRGDQVIGKWLLAIKKGRPVVFYGDGCSNRGYTYIGDVCRVVERLLTMEWDWEHEDFNLGGSETITLSELAFLFSRVFPEMRIERRKAPNEDVPNQYADIQKIRKALSFAPELGFKGRVLSILKGGGE